LWACRRTAYAEPKAGYRAQWLDLRIGQWSGQWYGLPGWHGLPEWHGLPACENSAKMAEPQNTARMAVPQDWALKLKAMR